MASSRKQLEYVITSDTRAFNRGLDSSASRLDQVGKAGRRLGIGLAAGAAAGTAAIIGIAAAAKKSVETTEELATSTIKLSRVTGQSTKAASQWVAQAKVRNIETQKLQVSFVAFSKQIVAGAEGTEASAKAFKALGIEQEALKRGNFDELIGKVSDAFERLPDGANKAAIAQRLFGKQAQALMPLLNSGSEALREQLDLTKTYGATVNEATVEQVKEGAAAQRELQLAFLGVKNTIGVGLLPVLTDFKVELAEIARDVQPAITKAMRGVSKIFNRKDLSLAEKFKLSGAELQKGFAPLIKEGGAAIKKMDIPKKLGDAFVSAAPKIVDALAASAPRAAGAFITAFKNANPWGQALTVAFLASKFGAFGAIGRWAAGRFLGGFTPVVGTGIGSYFGRIGRRPPAGWIASMRSLGGKLGIGLAASLFAAFSLEFNKWDPFQNKVFDDPGGGNDDDIFIVDALEGIFGDPTGKAAARPGSVRARRRAHRGAGGGNNRARTFGYGASRTRGGSGKTRPLASAASGKLSFRQIARLWVEAGGDPAYARLMAKLALRESGGNPSADNTGLNSDGSVDYGLWQINSVHAPTFGAEWAQRLDPLTNARMAVSIMDSQGPEAWTTYNSGDQKYVGNPVPGASSGAGSGATPKPKTVTITNRLQIANVICSKFGLQITDGWRPQDAGYGAENSWHKQGTPDNPGAVDMAGPMSNMNAALAWFKANVSGWAEAMVHEQTPGSGWHLHIGGTSMKLVLSGDDAVGVGGSAGPSRAAVRASQKKREGQLQRRHERSSARRGRLNQRTEDLYSGHRRREIERAQKHQERADRYRGDPYGTELALQDVAIAEAEGTKSTDDDVLAIAARAITLRGRLEQINKLLRRKNLTTARRKALLAEKASITGQLNALNQQYQDIIAPPEGGEGVVDMAALIENQTAQAAALTDAVKAHTAFQQQLLGTQTGQILAGVADMVSGQIAGRVGLGVQTPGWAGGRMRYGP